MYTRNIIEIVSLGKTGARWQGADIYKYWTTAPEIIDKKWNESSADFIKKLGVIIDQIDKKIDQTSYNEDKEVLKTQKEQILAAIDAIKKQTRLSVDTLAVNAMNTRKEQADRFIEELEKIPGLKDWVAENLKPRIDNNGHDRNEKYSVSSVSLPALASHILKGETYVSDGTYWPSERYAVEAIKDIYKKNSENIKPILEKALIANESGFTIVQGLSSKTLDPSENVASYISRSDDLPKTAGTLATMKYVSEILKDLSPSDLTKSLIKALSLWWYNGTMPTNDTSLKDLLTKDPNAKLAILSGIHKAVRHGGGEKMLLTDKSLTLNPNVKKILDTLNTAEWKAEFKEWLNKAITKRAEEILADNTEKWNPAQQKAAREALAWLQTTLADENHFNFHYQGFMAFLTNAGSGIGASFGGSLDTLIADSVSLAVGVTTGDKPFGVGLSFGKGITRNSSLLYGWAGKPFAWVAHRFDSGYDAVLIKTVGGISATLSKDMNNNEKVIKTLDRLNTDDSVKSQIDTYANSWKTSKEIVFSGTVPKELLGWSAADAITQDSFNATNRLISQQVQMYLTDSTFDTETNPLIRATLIQEALRRALQDRIDAINYDTNSGGWSLAKLGVTLGIFAGAKYILPYVSFEKRDLRVFITRAQWPVKITENVLKTTDLFGDAIFAKDGKTYKLPIKPNTLTKDNTDLGNTGAVFSDDGTVLENLTKNIKVSKGIDGKYLLTYTTNFTFTKWHEANAQLSELQSSVSDQLKDKKVREQLSRLWDPKASESRRLALNKFTTELNNIELWVEGANLTKANGYLVEATKGLPVLRNLMKSIENKDWPILEAAFFDIRWVMMMDQRQAMNVQVTQNGVEIKKDADAVRNDFYKLLDLPSMQSLLQRMWLTKQDYQDVIKGSKNDASYTIGNPEPNTIGAVASLKTTTKDDNGKTQNNPYMAHMPSGTMRFAKNGSGQFMKDVTDFTSEKKNKMFDTLVPEDGKTFKALKDSMKIDWLKYADMKKLFVEGKATIGWKEYTMTEQKFMLCAYGDCTNPAIALTPGKVTAEGKWTITPSAMASSLVEWSRTTRVDILPDGQAMTISIGYVKRKTTPETTETTTTTSESVTTVPGELRIDNGNILINGKPIWVIKGNGSITITTGTFRLAPGQTIEAFLGVKGIVIPPQSVTTVNNVTTIKAIPGHPLPFAKLSVFLQAMAAQSFIYEE
jgi:hypothetical protein